MEICDRFNIPPFPDHPMLWTPLQKNLYAEWEWIKYEKKHGIIPDELLEQLEQA